MLYTDFLVLYDTSLPGHDVLGMARAQENRKRMQLMFRSTMLAVRKSRKLLQQTDERLKQCQATSFQGSIKHPDRRIDQSLQ